MGGPVWSCAAVLALLLAAPGAVGLSVRLERRPRRVSEQQVALPGNPLGASAHAQPPPSAPAAHNAPPTAFDALACMV